MQLPPEQEAIRAKCFHPSGTFVEFPDTEQSIAERFEEIVRRYPGRLAVGLDTGSLTYDQLNKSANRIAQCLIRQSADGEAPVALLFNQGAAILAAILAVLKTGRIYVPLEPTLPLARLSDILADSRAQLLLTDTKNFSVAQNIARDRARIINCDEIEHDVSEENLGLSILLDAPALILYTSGSTGRPKGVLHSQRNIMVEARNYTNDIRICREDRLSLCQSCSFANSIRNIYGALLNGAALFPYELGAKELLSMAQWLAAEHITIFHTLATVIRRMRDVIAPDATFPDLRVLRFGGEPSGGADVKYFQQQFAPQCVLMSVIGLTETFAIRRCLVSEEFCPGDAKVPLGYGIPGKDVLLLDEVGQEVSAGQIGEIAVRSTDIALSYWQRADLTHATFLPDPAGGDNRVYLTGDLGLMRSDGCLMHMGRKDFQLKIRGHRVETTSIETALLKLPSVQAAIVHPQPDAADEPRLVAYVVPAPGENPTVGQIRRALAPDLPDYMIPSAVVFLEALPVVPNGRIDRRALPPLSGARPLLDAPYIAPRTALERELASIWAEFLNVKPIGIDDPFLELGGNSLLAARILSRIIERYHVTLPMRSIFETPTIAAMARVLAAFSIRPQTIIGEPVIARRERTTPAALSCSQQRLWFLHQWDLQSPAYNEASARRLGGPLDLSALRRALNAVAARHEILRTKIAVEGETPVQIIDGASTVDLAVVDLRAQASAPLEEEARRLMIETIRRPFDLTRDLPWRVSLLRMADDDQILLAVMHHIAFDGWSSQIFWRELTLLYGALKSGQPPAMEELPLQYQDYAEWQKGWLKSDALERQTSYWKNELDSVAVLQLPTDYPRPSVQSWRGSKEKMLLSKELADELRKLSRTERVTLFMTLLAAFQTLLYRYTSQEDIAVGCPVAGRTRPELEHLIGFFINTLIMRAQVSGEISFREFLRRVRETALSAYECQDVPFERLVELLQPQRDLSRNPLFQVTFQLRNFLQTPAPIAGLTSEPIELDAGIAKFDLALGMTESPEGLAASLEYNTDLFDAATAKRLLGHLKALLQGIAADPEQRLSHLPILTKAEGRQLLLDWNETARPYPKGECVHRLFETQVERTPDAVAVVFEGRRLSYRELNQRANHWAHILRAHGIGPDRLVGVCMERSLEMVIAVLAILKAGGAYVPLDPRHPVERLRSIIDDARLQIVLTRPQWSEDKKSSTANRGSFDPELQWLCIDSDTSDGQGERNPDGDIDSNHLAYVIYTSGSTGRPKGVLIEHRQIVNYLYGISERYRLAPGARYAMVQPLSVDSSHTALFPPLLFGGVLHVISEERARDGQALADYFADSKIDFLKIAPSHLAALQQSSPNPERLLPRRWLVIGGEPSPAAWVEDLRRIGSCAIFNHYGPTEATVGMLTLPITDESVAARSFTVPLGRPLPNTEAYVLDGCRNLVPIGIAGELYIGGDCLARGYLNLPHQTAESFVQHTFDGLPAKRLYRTGDRVRYRADGNIEFLGRVDHQVKIRGFRVEPAEIEAALRQHGAIRAAVVQAQKDPSGVDLLVAYAVVQTGKAVGEDALTKFLKSRLPDYMVPSSIVFLDALPLTAHGKVDLQALPPAPARRGTNADVIAPTSATEKLLAHIWAEVLGLAAIGVHDDFFALGGHSLKAMQVLSRLRAALHHAVPLRHLFEYPILAQLAAALDTELTGKNETMDRLLHEIEAVTEEDA